MKISLNWLNDYVTIDRHTPEQIADALTSIGLEVEGIEPISPLKGKVVVGEVLEASQHPNAEKLQICSVNIGEEEPLSIVCGAPNARPGIRVAVATIGSVLPGDFKIKSSKIRGEKSFGMLCSGEELGISAESDGILELEKNIEIGTSIQKHFQLEDTVLEIGLTPNRADCLGYVGVARDLGAKLDLELKQPQNKAPRVESLKSSDYIRVNIEDSSDCGRFTALYIKNVSVTPSPLWMQNRLTNSGMRPINLIVDITNYAMLEWGAPIHAYDERFIQGGEINVRRAKDNETLVSLDGNELKLTPNDIVISDKETAIGLAGVMGGANSEVQQDTKNIIVEVAHFDPSLIRKTSKRVQLHTEASHRFERGTDITNCDRVSYRVAELLNQCIQELNKSNTDLPVPEIASSLVDIYPNPHAPSPVALRLSRVRQILGLSMITIDECIEAIVALGFKHLDQTKERILFEVPTWRRDIEREIDLIEEVARLHGFDRIPLTLPKMDIKPNVESSFIEFCDNSKFSMAESGFTEIISFPFISPKDLNHFNLSEAHPLRSCVKIANPLVEDQSLLHSSLSFVLLKALTNNRKHGDYGTRLFEVAKCFYEPLNGKPNASFPLFENRGEHGIHVSERAQKDNRPNEKMMIAGILDQPWMAKAWSQPEVATSFYHGKSIVCQWLNSFGISEPIFKPIDPKQLSWLHPTAAAELYIDDKFLGYVGEVHPKTVECYELDIEKPPVIFEMDLELIYKLSQTPAEYESITTRFPPVTRDLAFIVDQKVCHQDFVLTLGSFKRKKNLKNYDLFDVYEGENLPEGKKSMGYKFSFQSTKKTLTDKEVENELNNLMTHLKDELSAELR